MTREYLFKSISIFVLLFAALATVGGCGAQPPARSGGEHVHEAPNGDGHTPPTESDQAQEAPSGDEEKSRTVSIADGEFSPAHLSIKAGATVTWVNNGKEAHEIHANDDSFHSPALQPGQSFSQTFDRAGDVDYHCHRHPNKKGMVMVD